MTDYYREKLKDVLERIIELDNVDDKDIKFVYRCLVEDANELLFLLDTQD